MPQRTNPFQELVALIERAFAKEGDIITESVMVKVHGLETEREIDILHETSTGLHAIKIAVEAKDEGRPMDLTTFDSYLAKFRGEGRVTVDKVVMVSRHGFTSGVKEKAKLVDVAILTLDEAKETDWTTFGPQYAGNQKCTGIQFKLAPHICRIEIVPPLDATLEQVALKEGRAICTHGHDHGSPFEIAQRGMKQGKYPPAMFRALEEATAASPNGNANARIEWPLAKFRLRLRGIEYPLERLFITIHSANGKGTVDTKLYEITDADGKKRVVQHMSAEVAGKTIAWLMPDGLHSKKVTLNIKNTPKPSTLKTPKDRAEERKRQRKKSKKKAKLRSQTPPSAPSPSDPTSGLAASPVHPDS